jgi:hypothetical protein
MIVPRRTRKPRLSPPPTKQRPKAKRKARGLLKEARRAQDVRALAQATGMTTGQARTLLRDAGLQ